MVKLKTDFLNLSSLPTDVDVYEVGHFYPGVYFEVSEEDAAYLLLKDNRYSIFDDTKSIWKINEKFRQKYFESDHFNERIKSWYE
jgi:uncharacterized cupin superfamily protein